MGKKFIFIFLCVNSIFVFSEGTDTYNITFEALELKNIDESYSHLSYSYPGLLLSELQNAQIHYFSEEERRALKQQNLKELRDNYLLTLSELIDQHDRFIFSSDYNDSEYMLLSEDIKKQRELIAEMDDSDVSEPDLNISIHFNSISSSGSEPGQSGDNQSLSSALIIKGSIEKLDNWVYTQFWVKNTILNTLDLVYESAGSIDNLKNQIPEISSRLKTVILGRPWSVIQFNLTPKDSNVRIKNSKAVIVSEDPGFYFPGIYSIEISKPGYTSKEITTEINSNENKVIDVKLEKKEKTIISLQTFPSGADLYSGSIWLGKTPVLLENPLIPSLLTLKLEGYNESKYIFKSKDDRDIRIFLHTDLINKEQIIQSKRNQFYKSFSYFLVSLPISIVSYGLSSDYGYAYNREVLNAIPSSEADRLMQISTTWYNVYLSSVFINITLFVNTFFDLLDYIKSNNDL